jgi:predicted ABC-type ATPase
MAKTLRLRVFAGPNGSGKSTMYTKVREAFVNGRPVDMGVYVNPDEIERILRTTNHLNLLNYGVNSNKLVFERFARSSGLLPIPR